MHRFQFVSSKMSFLIQCVTCHLELTVVNRTTMWFKCMCPISCIEQNPSLHSRSSTQAASEVAFRCISADCLMQLGDATNAVTLLLQLHKYG